MIHMYAESGFRFSGFMVSVIFKGAKTPELRNRNCILMKYLF